MPSQLAVSLVLGMLCLPMTADPPGVLTTFTPNDAVSGVWAQSLASESMTLPPESGVDCSGQRRGWSRSDGIEVRFAWFTCPATDIESIARGQAWQRLSQSAQEREQSALDGNADLFVRLDSKAMVRTWIQSGYVLQLGVTPCETTGQVAACSQLTAAMAKSISGRLPGQPTVASGPSFPFQQLIGGFLCYWLLFIGLPMLGFWIARPQFNAGPPHPRVVNVDAAAQRLRWIARGRRTGTALVVIGLLGAAASAAVGIRTGALSPGTAACSAVGLLLGGVLIATCRHPQLSAKWLRYRPRLRHFTNIRRLGGLGLTLVLAGLSVLAPITALVFLALAATLSMAGEGGSEISQDLGRIFAGLFFAAIGAGFFIDYLARRLRARNVDELLADRDDEDPLLYLRNFGDDELKVPPSIFSRTSWFQMLTAAVNPIRRVRFEEPLTRLLSRWGPVIALNQPGLKLASLGAAKQVAANDRWQEDIIERAEAAYAVIISATPTTLGSGLLWELDMTATRLSHSRIVLIVGPDAQKDQVIKRWGWFTGAVEKYPRFAPLSQGWVPEGTLVLVHVPTRGWYAWSASRRTAWTYAAAIDAAFTFAAPAWTETGPPMPENSVFTETVVSAMHDAAAQAGQDNPVDTRRLLLGLMRADRNGDWGRFWLHGADPVAIAAAEGLRDPHPQPWGYWYGKPTTFACENAVTRSIQLSRQYNMTPVPPGLLAYTLIQDRGNSATVALGISSQEHHEALLAVVQDDLIGVTLGGTGVL